MRDFMSKTYQFMLVLLSIVCLVIASESIILKTLVLSPGHWLKVTTESDYVAETTDSINQSISDLGLGSGIKEGGLDSVITKEQVEEDFTSFLSNALVGTPFTIDQDNIKAQINDAVEDYAKEEDHTMNKKNQASVDQFVEAAYQKYDRGIRNRLISMVGLRTSMVDKLLTTVITVFLGLLLVLLLLIYLVERRYVHIFFRNVSHLLATSSLLLVAINLIYYIKEPLKDLTVLNEGLKTLVSDGLKLPLLINWGLAIIFLLSSVAIGVASYSQYSKLKKKSFRRKNREDLFELVSEEEFADLTNQIEHTEETEE